MELTNQDGFPTITQASLPVPHVIDDEPSNKLDKPAFLYVGGEEGDIKVQGSKGRPYILHGYKDGVIAVTVCKIWLTGTTIDISKIQLLR